MRNGMSQPGNGMIQSGNGMGDPFSDFTKSLQISMTPVVNEIVSEVISVTVMLPFPSGFRAGSVLLRLSMAWMLSYPRADSTIFIIGTLSG